MSQLRIILFVAAISACSPPTSTASAPAAGAPPEGSDAGPGDPGDARTAGRSAGPRTLIARPLLGTSIRSVLLDPFVTPDGSWGHFVAVLIAGDDERPVNIPIRRAYYSQVPAGVTIPIAVLPAPSSVNGAFGSLQIVAPFPGGSDPFDARIWVSAGDASGQPVPFERVAGAVTVAVLPNDQPSHAFPLARAAAPVELGDRQWVLLGLPTPAPVPRGGWLSIVVHDANVSLRLQAPEVTPSAHQGPHPAPLRNPRTIREQAAPRAYPAIIRRPDP